MTRRRRAIIGARIAVSPVIASNGGMRIRGARPQQTNATGRAFATVKGRRLGAWLLLMSVSNAVHHFMQSALRNSVRNHASTNRGDDRRVYDGAGSNPIACSIRSSVNGVAGCSGRATCATLSSAQAPASAPKKIGVSSNADRSRSMLFAVSSASCCPSPSHITHRMLIGQRGKKSAATNRWNTAFDVAPN